MILHVGEPSDDADHRDVRGEAEADAGFGGLQAAADERLQVEAHRHHVPAFGRPDPEREELVAHLRRHRDQRVGARGERPLHARERGVLHPGEVGLQHVTVEGVHDDGHAGLHGRRPAQRARLGEVRVHEVRTPAPDDAADGPRRAQVVRGTEVAAEPRQVSVGQVRGWVDRALGGSGGAPYQARVEATRTQGVGEEDGLARGTAHVQAGGHAQHPGARTIHSCPSTSGAAPSIPGIGYRHVR